VGENKNLNWDIGGIVWKRGSGEGEINLKSH